MFAFAWLLQSLCPVAANADNPTDITFDKIKFDIKKGAPFKRSMLTDKINDLDGATIRIRGYILPLSVFKQTGIKRFVLVRDNMQCCFGPGAAIYDCIMIEMVDNATTSFTVRPIAVEGKFTVKEYKAGKRLMAIYRMEATKAK